MAEESARNLIEVQKLRECLRGVLEIAWVLRVGPNTIIQELKKAAVLSQVNKVVVDGYWPDAITVEVRRVEAAKKETLQQGWEEVPS